MVWLVMVEGLAGEHLLEVSGTGDGGEAARALVGDFLDVIMRDAQLKIEVVALGLGAGAAFSSRLVKVAR
jgi:hypothetical protein